MKLYLKKEAIFDFVANIPFIFFMPAVGLHFDISDLDQVNRDILYTVFALRCFHLIHLHDTASSLRRLVTKLGSIFYLQSYMFYNLLSWTLASFKFIIVVHYMTCFWIGMQFHEDNTE